MSAATEVDLGAEPGEARDVCDELLAADAWLGRCDETALAAGERVFRDVALSDALARLRGTGGRAAAVADLIELHDQLTWSIDGLAAASGLASAELRNTLERSTFTTDEDPDVQVVQMAQALAEVLEMLAGRSSVAELTVWAGEVAAGLRAGPGTDGRLVATELLEA